MIKRLDPTFDTKDHGHAGFADMLKALDAGRRDQEGRNRSPASAALSGPGRRSAARRSDTHLAPACAASLRQLLLVSYSRFLRAPMLARALLRDDCRRVGPTPAPAGAAAWLPRRLQSKTLGRPCRMRSGKARSASGWSTCRWRCIRRRRTSASISTGSTSGRWIRSATSGSTSAPARRSSKRRTSSRASSSRRRRVRRARATTRSRPPIRRRRRRSRSRPSSRPTEIPFTHLEKPYYLEPLAKGEKVYALLREAMLAAGVIGVARVVMHTKERLCRADSRRRALLLNTHALGRRDPPARRDRACPRRRQGDQAEGRAS